MKKGAVPSILVGVMLLCVALIAEAQQPMKVFRIGIATGRSEANNPGPQVEAFGQGLRALGYIEGKNILIEYRFLEGNPDVYSKLVVELVSLKVDVLVLFGSLPAIRAAKQATKTIPIVIVTTQDPVGTGIVNSLARPGGNITGVTTLQRELSGKRLELLKDAVPGISRVGALVNATQLGKGPDEINDFQWYEVPARALKINLQSVELRGPNPDFKGAFQAVTAGRATGLITVQGSLLNRYQKQIADLAIKNRLPSMHERSDYVEAGGLMSYSANDAESSRRAAWYVDKILKGTKPADLPVEQPTKFEFVINLKTAKQIGLTIPPEVLARANRLIK
jgi:putative tryptophan/tyrosine transport system substrate-binding protein